MSNFSFALQQIKNGVRMKRDGWNEKGMFVFLVPGSTFKVSRPPLLGIYDEGTEVNYGSHIDKKFADGTVEPWTPAQRDILANDWDFVDVIPGDCEVDG